MTPADTPWPDDLHVLVLCADWCTQCRAFREVTASMDTVPLHWIDIEDAGLDADELQIDAFPSVAIFRPAGVLRYLGPVRADRDGFLAALGQLHRLAERPLPSALREVLPG
ncbi:MAG: hypothetical protein KF871_05720 [Hydrogenophaga sp.]|uniref:hypothetical protein n=1 Tax=Hydrogenophaga sp. TaxID=1904254 RepID=UPI001D8FB4F8|nr:hypothetical protein [Hydrogenophaga sp.]MBX3609377.1 hypothetical protein [Hydrogenophaga sp.]